MGELIHEETSGRLWEYKIFDMQKEEVIKRVEKSGHLKIKVAITDIDGVLRGKIIHKDKFISALNSKLGFCDVVFGWDSGDVCYDNVEFTGWHSGYPDAKAQIDYATIRQIPWDNSMPFFLADFSGSGSNDLAVCPRNLLRKINRQCESLGFQAIYAQEFEWFNFKSNDDHLSENNFAVPEPMTSGMFGYSVLRTSQKSDYFNAIFDQLAEFDIPLEGMHTETGPGVYEAAIYHDNIIAAADKATLFKTSVKEIASRHELIASFMAKWNSALPGCGGHIHQSLWDSENKNNLFYSADGMSDILQSFIAGQLYCLPDILPMYAPTINSYKRLSEGAWAPTTITWGMDNRTTAIRVIPGNNNSMRVEMRVPGSDCNPYLAMAAALASGLYGIKNNLKLQIKPTKGNGYTDTQNGKLSSNLMDATQKMKNSNIANELFGEAFVKHFINTREWEWNKFMQEVTDWELKRYFEII